MMSCEQYKNIFEAYIDGTVTSEQKRQLETHIETCAECRRVYQTHCRMETVLSECYTLPGPSGEIIHSILTTAANPEHAAKTAPVSTSRWFGYAIAAGIFLAIGLFLGSQDVLHSVFPKAKPLAISISNLQGDVLIKHPWEQSWKTLSAKERIYKGDAFLSLNQSQVRLVLGQNKYVDLSENSSLNLMQYNGQTEFGIAYGTVKSSLDGPHEPFFISTPQGRLQALGTEFIVRVR